ncbi:hypothetical protein GDO78_020984 [Eleutherodactylus coqui]|uniref:Transmembrane protein n=1 Tax=Eleutherodactylus coqui TaxID=57060 RepID=A0A8J6BF44_ELECQ|nr:hypothetical protein GDO78_020984 [Eleutherodactylus coqui]
MAAQRVGVASQRRRCPSLAVVCRFRVLCSLFLYILFHVITFSLLLSTDGISAPRMMGVIVHLSVIFEIRTCFCSFLFL